jgi:hypothetical protein
MRRQLANLAGERKTLLLLRRRRIMPSKHKLQQRVVSGVLIMVGRHRLGSLVSSDREVGWRMKRRMEMVGRGGGERGDCSCGWMVECMHKDQN